MLTKKKKLSRKEIKKDKLVTSYYESISYFQQNKQKLLIYAGIAAVIVVAVLFYLNHRSQSNEAAGLQLARVIPLYDAGSYLEAIEGRQGTNIVGLKKIVEEYGSTENGETAKIYLANSYLFMGQLEDAFKYYSDYSGSIPMFNAVALAGEAGYFESKGEHKKAADLYRKASRVSEGNVLNPEYMLKAGINYIKGGQNDVAKELLETIKRDYTTSSAARDVDRFLTQLN